MLLYGLFGFNYFPEDFFFPAILPDGENMCSSAWQCYLTVFSLCPRSTGCIGDVMQKQSFKGDNKVHFYVRYFYDVSLFMIINLLLVKIFFSILIDNFLQILRNERMTYEEDESVCFICSLDKSVFDTLSSDFRFHVTSEHNMWHYLAYAFSIKSSRTTIQMVDRHVLEKIAQGDISWFPVKHVSDS